MRLRTHAGLLAALAGLVLVPWAPAGATGGGHPGSAPASARIVVRFVPGTSRGAETRLLRRAGARSVETLPHLHAAVATVAKGRRASFLLVLRHTRSVAATHADGTVHLLGGDLQSAASSSASGSWQIDRTGLPQAWQVTQGDANVVVAVVDTGVQADHPGLAGRVLPGHDFVNNDDDASDDNGHGTAVAGVVAAAGVGACAQCRILPVKVLGADGTGTWGAVADGIVWAADQGAQVINVSIGAPRALDVVGAAVSYAESKGAIVVAAAGNDGRDEPFYPAAYPGVVSVAGVDPDGNRYPWSNYGGWISVAAPGCISTTWVNSQFDHEFCGTSAAAPFVAGLAGLARSFRSTLTLPAFSSALTSSTAPLPDPGTAAAGRVDANGLLIALGAPSGPPVAASTPTVLSTPVVGRRLTATAGDWQSASSLAFSWQRSRSGQTWQGAGSGPSYTPRVADRGFHLRVVVTAQNVRGAATASSVASKPVAAPARQARPAHAPKRKSRRRVHR